jgi:hypothetical protein
MGGPLLLGPAASSAAAVAAAGGGEGAVSAAMAASAWDSRLSCPPCALKEGRPLTVAPSEVRGSSCWPSAALGEGAGGKEVGAGAARGRASANVGPLWAEASGF